MWKYKLNNPKALFMDIGCSFGKVLYQVYIETGGKVPAVGYEVMSGII